MKTLYIFGESNRGKNLLAEILASPLKTTALVGTGSKFCLEVLRRPINGILHHEFSPGLMTMDECKKLWGGESMQVDVKHSDSYPYEKSLPLILTSNYSIDAIAKFNDLHADALRNRSREIFLFAPLVDTEDEYEQAVARGENVVLKPAFTIQPELICAMLEKEFEGEDAPTPRLMSASELQQPPAEVLERFLQKERAAMLTCKNN